MNVSRSTLVITVAAVLGIATPAFAQRAEGAKARASAKVSTEVAVDAAKAAREASKDAKASAKAAAMKGNDAKAHAAHHASIAAEDAKNKAVELAQRAEGAADATESGVKKSDAAADARQAARAASQASASAAANSNAAHAATHADTETRATVPASPNASPNSTIARSYPGAMADYRHTTGAGRYHIDTNVLDTNRDGFLSREEAGANLTLNTDFAAIDVDNDGRIANDELRTWVRSGGLAKNSRPLGDLLGGVGVANAFQMLDTNSDGVLSKSEVRVQSKLNSRFNRLDSDRDGRLTQAEFDVWAKASAGSR